MSLSAWTSTLIKELRRSRGIHTNPWSHFPRLITSIDFLKRDRQLRQFREVLPSDGEPVYPRAFDLLVLDEAHNCAPAGRGKYATDSLRTQALRALAPHFEHRLFLTATPHNGYVESFSALLELLDNQRFARGALPDHRQLGAVMVRRLKSELKRRFDGSPRFAERKLHAIEVPYTDEEREIHAALREYTKLRQKGAVDRTERIASEFVLTTLKKRLFSCPAAFRATLEQHEASLRTATRGRTARRPSEHLLQREINKAEEEYGDDALYEEATTDAVDAATRLFSALSDDERRLLGQMKSWAAKAEARKDSKVRQLIAWLEENVRPAGRWSDQRVIIFTEYRATQNWLHTVLTTEGFGGGDRLLTMYGGMDSEKRERIKAAFQAGPHQSDVRILLATDAASEGLDLQNHCSRLIHYEIPWNPNRMEQRNGRIDRHGQKAAEVRICHFVGAGYREKLLSAVAVRPGDLEGDLHFLMQAAEKVQTIREDLGKVGPVIADQVMEAMLGQRGRLETEQAERDAGPVRQALRIERDIQRDIQRLRDQLDDTQRELRLSPTNIRKAVEVGLQLAGQPPLIPAEVEGIWPHPRSHTCPVFHVPALKGSWAACTEGLAHPHTGETRPIVFDYHLADGRDDVVLAHLNHRLVQMCLRLLRAEVWSTGGGKGLHRITARLVPDTALRDPAMIAFARLVVIGGNSRRLHEEVITAGGYLREGRFARIRTLSEVNTALAEALTDEPSEPVKAKLLNLYREHQDALLRAIEARMQTRVRGLRADLERRTEREASDIKTILTELRETIRAKLEALPEQRQQLFEGWVEDEMQQFERNLSAIRARIREIPGEIERETAAIRARFADPQPRMFPVAVTFLVPQKLARG